MAYKSHKFGKRNGKKHFNAVGVRTAQNQKLKKKKNN